MGKYKDSIDAQRRSMSPEQISRAKNARCKERNAYMKEDNIAQKTERENFWQSLTPQEQLKRVDYRNGKGVGAVKERQRINARILIEEVKKEVVSEEVPKKIKRVAKKS